MNKAFRGITVGLVAVTFLVIGLVIASQLSFTPPTEAGQKSLWKDGSSESSTSRPGSFADLAEELSPAVVNISTATVVKERSSDLGRQNPFGDRSPFRDFFGDEFFRRFFDGPKQPRTQRSLGSGFIINEGGYIITNNHVVDGADEIVVILKGGDEYPAKVIGKDKKTDLALIKIEPKNGLPITKLGDSDKSRVGDWVLAIGNPFGLGHTVTAGIISAKGRELGAGPYDDFIQTDTAINPGSSGGPLFDMAGNVIGINSAIYTRSGGYQGVGFSIPINLAKNIITQLKGEGTVTRAWLGVLIQRITPELQESLDLKTRRGALVADVVENGPAAKAGIKRGDVVISFNSQDVDSQHELPTMVAYLPVGKEVEVVVIRGGKKKTFKVVLEQMEDEPVIAGKSIEEHQEGLGLTVQDITEQIAEQLNLKGTLGVLVSGVNQGGLAAEAGIRRGDVILEVNRSSVKDVKSMTEILKRDKDKKSVLFLINRSGRTIFVALSK